jgi:hypothetical protein
VTALVISPQADLSVSIVQDAVTIRDDAVKAARQVVEIADDLDLVTASEALRTLKHLAREVEASRQAVKTPVTKLGRQIDATADDFVAVMVHEIARVSQLMSEYHAAQKRIAQEAQRIRMVEEAKIAFEARKLRYAAQDAEAARLSAMAADRDAAEREMLGQQVRQAELDGIAARRITAEQQSAALVAQQAKLAAAATAIQKPVAAPVRTAGMLVRDVWQFEVTDIWQIPRDLVRIEPNKEAIHAALRAGVETIPGLKVWKETRVGVR